MQNCLSKKAIIRKLHLNDQELIKAFNIIKSNMEELGVNVSEEDKTNWWKNITDYLNDPTFYFYLVYLNGEIVGFVEIVNKENTCIISEVQLNNKAKHTRIILDIITHLFNCEEFSKVYEMSFYILKQNSMSNKTFSHLGGKIVSENDRKYEYIISRDSVNSYLSKFER